MRYILFGKSMLKDKGYHCREYRPKKWQVYFQHKGKQIQLQKDQNGHPLHSEEQAAGLMMYLDAKGYDPRLFKKDKEFYFSEAVKVWIDLSTCSEEWKAERARLVKKFMLPYFGNKDIREVKTIHIDQFQKHLKDQGLKPGYLHNVMGELRTFFRFHKESLNKMPEFRKIPVQMPAIKWLTPEEQDRVFKFIPKHHIPIFTFLRSYPVRPNEACGLLKSRVIQDAPVPYFIIDKVVTRGEIVKEFTKTRQAKVLPIIPGLEWIFEGNGEGYLFTRKNGKPYINTALSAIWREANRRSGVKQVSMYQGTKHSRGWQMIEDGRSMEEVSLVMGHTSTRHTKRYAGYTLRKMLEILTPSIDFKSRKLLTYKDNIQTNPSAPHCPYQDNCLKYQEFKAGKIPVHNPSIIV